MGVVRTDDRNWLTTMAVSIFVMMAVVRIELVWHRTWPTVDDCDTMVVVRREANIRVLCAP